VHAGEIPRISLAGRLHDIGKVAIPTAILLKPGPLDEREWEVMRTHAETGERILRSAASLADVALLVRHHHERYDGSGYPDGLDGARTPLGSSVITVCAAFTAMMRQRPYSDAITVAEPSCGGARGPSSTPVSWTRSVSRSSSACGQPAACSPSR
jgi:response regulator RpfG family c-di-GMP phosphodiesterase